MSQTRHPRPQRFLRLAAICCAAATLGSRSNAQDLFFQLTPQRANQAADGAPSGDDAERAFELSSGLTVTPRRLLNALTRAQTFIEQGLYADAIPLLQAVLDSPPDGGYRVTEGESGLLRNLSREAERVVGGMPLDGLIAYDLSSGPDARKLLDEARANRDVERLLETSRRFFHTDAGHEATYLLGMLHLDRGRPFEAALCFDRELQALTVSGKDGNQLLLHSAIAWNMAGRSDLALARLRKLVENDPHSNLRIGGRNVTLPGPQDDARTWLRESIGPQPPSAGLPPAAWTICRGNPARTAAASCRTVGGELAWSIPTSSWKVPRDDTPFATGVLNVSRQIGGIERDYRKSDLPAIPQVRPLIVGRRAILRTITNLQALDLDTGGLLWESARDDVPDRIRTGEIEPLPGDRGSILDPLLNDRIFLNAAYGTLSADANCVFCVERLGMPADVPVTDMRNFAPSGQVVNRHPLSDRTDSELSAYALQDGRQVWTVGGNRRETPEPRLAGGYFLGPPLPLGGQLFGLAEFERRIVLYVLDADDGKLQWSLALQEYELDVSRDSARARAGLSPSFADGVLVCPTGSGVVVAVDVSTRQLLWSARYRPLTPEATSNRAILMARIAARRGIPSPPPPRIEARWLDALAMLSGNRVILTPLDTDKLLCLDLHEGTLLWEQPRKGRLFIGGIRGDSLIVVGTGSVEQLSLETGQPVETPTVPIPRPGGRGLLDGDVYYLPLDTGEIAAIDLPTARITSHIKLPPDTTTGNLVAAGDNIIMQGCTAISRFASRKTGETERAKGE